MKKFLAAICFLTGIFILSISTYASVETVTQNGITYQIQNTKNVYVTKCDETVSDVVIPEYVNGFPVTYIFSNAFKDNQTLTSITLPSTLELVCPYAFAQCENLDSVIFNGNNLTKIDRHAFDGCVSLKEVVLPESVRELCDQAFANCTNLEYIRLPGSSAKTGERVFESCPKLKSAGPIDSGSNIEFGWKTEIPSDAFGYMYSLKSVILPETMTKIGVESFYHCANLTSINLPDSISQIDRYAFSFCTSLTSVDLPDSLNMIASNTFQNCTNLTTVDVPKSVTKISDFAFSSCNKLKNITLPVGNLKEISESAFFFCSSLESIIIPEGVTTLGYHLFLHCTNLQYVQLPKSLTSLKEIFYSCQNIKTAGPIGSGCNVEFNWDTFIPDSAFNQVTTLEKIEIPDTVTTIGKSAFYKCSGLQSITLPKNLTTIGDYAFYECKKLEQIVLPDTLTSIGSYIFSRCSNLEKVIILGSLESSGGNSFQGCSELTSIGPIGSESSIEIASTKVFPSLSGPDSNIQYIVIPEGTITIDHNAFYKLNTLKEIYIPNSVTSIGSQAFYECTSLEYVLFDGNANEWTNIMTNSPSCELYSTNAEIYIMQYSLPFVDISESDYFYHAVDWAFLNGIVNGIDETHFGPDESCTRGQAATFLWRTFGREKPVINNPFLDIPANTYYTDAVLWAYQYGITTGVDAKHFNPDGLLTRAEFVTFLWRTQGEPKPQTKNIFADVPEKSFYHDAVLWAYENGITSGVDATHFNPTGLCTRAHVVTFLYRAFGEEIEEAAV